jgi:hypothetical protein
MALTCRNMADIVAIYGKPNRLHSITTVELNLMQNVRHGTAIAFYANIAFNRHSTPSINY